MNQTSLLGRPLHALTRTLVQFGEKRGYWTGPLTLSSPEIARLFGAPPTSTGMGVDEGTAFTYSVFWACVNNISTDIGSFPLNLYKLEPDGGKTLLRDHKLFPLLHDAPNPEMTAFTFRGLLTSNALTHGMGYAEKVRDGMGRVAELWPITPTRVSVKRELRAPYRVYYEVMREDGGIDRLTSDQMFVLPGSTLDGVYGRNIVTMARESIGLGLAAERFGGTFYGNGSTFGGVFEHPGRMTDQAIKNFRESVNAQHQGVDRAHKFIVVEEGMKFQRLTVDQDAAQFIETRQHQIEEMCRWFRMPPHKVQHLIRTSYNSVEQMNIEYSTDTLTPWCVRWEQEVKRQLIAPSERRIQFVKHNMDSKLRGDTAARYEAYTKGIQNGFLCQDDVREKEDLNPLPGGAGKKFFIQSNTQPLNRVDEIIDKQVAPDPTPVAPEPAPPDDSNRQIAEALEQAIAASDARAAAMATQIATLESEKGGLEARTSEQGAAEAALRAELAAEQSAGVSLKAQLLDVTERMTRLAAEQDAERLTAEDLRAQVAAAHADAQRVQDTAAEETARLQAQADEQAAHAVALAAERETLRAAHEQAAADASQLAMELAGAKAEAVVLQATAAEEAARWQTELEALTARAAQAEQDREVMAQTSLVAAGVLTDLQAALVEAETINAQTSETLSAERAALEEARAELARLQAAFIETQAELARLAEARATDATTAAQAVDEAHRAAMAASEQLVQATADADTARGRLEDVSARALAEQQRVAEEQAAHEATRTLLKATKKAEIDRLQKLNISQRGQIEYTWGQMVEREVRRAKGNALTPTKLKAWARDFYTLHLETCIDALRPTLRAHLTLIGSTDDVDLYARGLIQSELEQAQSQLRAVADGDPEEFQDAMNALFARWLRERPLAVANRIQEEGATHVSGL